MKRLAGTLAAFVVCAWGAVARAELKLSDVLATLDRTPVMQAAAADRRAAEGERVSADGAFDAVVRARGVTVPTGAYEGSRVDLSIEQPIAPWGASLFAGYRLQRGPLPLYDGKLATNDAGEVRAGVGLPLLRNNAFDRRRASVARGRAGEEIAARGADAARLDTARRAALAYWDWVAAGQRAALAVRLHALAVARVEQFEARVARGDLPALERDDNARAIQQRASQVASAERALRGAALELSMYLRDEAGEPRAPSPSDLPAALPDVPAEEGASVEAMVATALAARPELPRLRAQRVQAEADARVAAAQRAPALDLALQVSKDLGRGPTERAPTEIEAVLSLELPVQNRAASGRDTAARAQVVKLGLAERLARDRVRVEVADAHAAVAAARLRVAAAREEVRLARRVEEGEQRRLTLGESNVLVVNQREQASFDAAVREVDALAELHRARANLRAAAGQPAETH